MNYDGETSFDMDITGEVKHHHKRKLNEDAGIFNIFTCGIAVTLVYYVGLFFTLWYLYG